MNEDRERKLKLLSKGESAKNTVIVTSAEPFVEALESKINQLKETLELPIEVKNLDNLLEQLEILQQFHQEVKSLKETFKSITLPDSVRIEGIEQITEVAKSLPRVDESITEIKATFNAIHKSVTDDIYSRYDFANSAQGTAGKYVGYLAHNGAWFIQRIGVSATQTSSTYAAGVEGYAQNWRNREKITYLPRDQVVIV